MALALELGFACQDIQGIRRDLAQMPFSRLTNRSGKAIFRTITITMSMPRMAAEQIFPPLLLNTNESKFLGWEATTVPEISQLLGNMLSEISPVAHGLTRAVQPPSESVARVFAVIMPTVEVSHAVLPYGAEHLSLNCQYALFDNSAELHPPKDTNRREVPVNEAMATSLRQQVLEDMLQLSI